MLPLCYYNLLNDNKGDSDMLPSYKELLHLLDLKNIGMSTAWRWLIYHGYKYNENKRCYYTDGHERQDVVNDRNIRFLPAYFNYEKQAHCWVQMSECTAIEHEKCHDDLPPDCYYTYHTDTNIAMREYHVDSHKSLRKFVTEVNQKYGGELSVRRDKNKKTIMLIGQDESTFQQYMFSKYMWKLRDGTHTLIPKSEGEIYMVSGFQSREFGLGLGELLTPQILERINNKRENEEYK